MFSRKKRPDQRVEDIDPAFDPWEQSRPIPLFVIAIFIALAIWGALNYVGDLAPERASQTPELPVTVTVPDNAMAPGADVPVLVHQGNASVWSCASCHGDQGQGSGQTPKLAGLAQAYIVKQLQDFAAGTRSNESMRYVATQLTLAEMNAVAAYYATLPVSATAAPKTGANMARGRELNLHGDWKQDIPACVTCHGAQGEGLGTAFPRLAGQQPEYLFSQLAAWKGGSRHNSPQSLMDDIAARMSSADMWAVSQYFGSLQPADVK